MNEVAKPAKPSIELSTELAESPTNSAAPLPLARKSRGVAILFTVLIAWCLLISIGLFRTQASTDYRRPLIMVLTMGTFLGIWALALRSKNRV